MLTRLPYALTACEFRVFLKKSRKSIAPHFNKRGKGTATRGTGWKGKRRANFDSDAGLHNYLKVETGLRRNRVIMQPAATDETLRLTGYLRSFAGVSPELSRQPVLVDERLVRRKQKIQRAGGSPEKNWSQLKAEIAARCAGPDLAKVSCWSALIRVALLPFSPQLQTELRQLHKSARDIGTIFKKNNFTKHFHCLSQ